MKKRFECDWCNGLYSNEKECLDHESRCCENPETKACETCSSHGTEVAGTGKVWNTCDKGLLKSHKWVENHARNCPQWQDWRKES